MNICTQKMIRIGDCTAQMLDDLTQVLSDANGERPIKDEGVVVTTVEACRNALAEIPRGLMGEADEIICEVDFTAGDDTMPPETTVIVTEAE